MNGFDAPIWRLQCGRSAPNRHGPRLATFASSQARHVEEVRSPGSTFGPGQRCWRGEMLEIDIVYIIQNLEFVGT